MLEIGKPGNVAPGSRQIRDEAELEPFGYLHEHDRERARLTIQRRQCGGGSDKNDVRCCLHQLGCVGLQALFIATRPTIFDRNVAALHPSQPLQSILERREPSLHFGIALC